MKERVVIGFLGSTLDAGKNAQRWDRWRPSVAMCSFDDLLIDRAILFHDEHRKGLMERITTDIAMVSPETTVQPYDMNLKDPWDFGEVYGALYDFSKSFDFDLENCEYLINMTTGTHVAQICLFLLTETHFIPARLFQLNPPKRWKEGRPGDYNIIDLDLSRYDQIAQRFQVDQQEATSILKSGIETRNPAFNQMIDRIEKVAIRSHAPLLLTGPTGAGKSQLAKKIFSLKQVKHQVSGSFIEVNCATLRGDGAMSALFGHTKGAFTGATTDRKGMLRAADKGVLFLDEIGELGLDEQAMILRAIEEKIFFPVGADTESTSDFQLIAGTNRDLASDVRQGRFREDLFARLNLWTFKLPGLRDRREDLEPNLEYELRRHSQEFGENITFNKEARHHFLKFANSNEAIWSANFRDLGASITRMSTLSIAGRITEEVVRDEIIRLKSLWNSMSGQPENKLNKYLTQSDIDNTDLFDQVQLAEVLSTCEKSDSLSSSGRTLFAASRSKKKVTNDADRLKKYLSRFNLDWQSIKNISSD